MAEAIFESKSLCFQTPLFSTKTHLSPSYVVKLLKNRISPQQHHQSHGEISQVTREMEMIFRRLRVCFWSKSGLLKEGLCFASMTLWKIIFYQYKCIWSVKPVPNELLICLNINFVWKTLASIDTASIWIMVLRVFKIDRGWTWDSYHIFLQKSFRKFSYGTTRSQLSPLGILSKFWAATE